MTKEQLKQKIDALEESVASGSLSVRSYSLDGEAVTYASVSEQLRVLGYLKAQYRAMCGLVCGGMPFVVPRGGR